ncbi:group II intron reverse transcriptase/maturase [Pseudomonas sp. ZB1P45]|uniref:group II intron reverse transcriptase/maturase n=1 Tax=Pseudomonas frigoris TaxID=3398356 RepID=UPI0039EFD2DA
MMSMPEAKSFDIAKLEVWDAYKRVKANRGAAGVDEVSIDKFDRDLGKNLYRIWNRMASGSYFPSPVKRVDIPKGDGNTRPLGIPTVADRIAQMVVRQRLEPLLEPIFHKDSYGYRPGRSAHDALRAARSRCWRHSWVLDLDIKGFFDNIDHDLLLKAVQRHTDCRWIALYIKRWLTADVVLPDGTQQMRDRGTPQGGVISPLLANLFLHYAFDKWMERHYPTVLFERYADDVICHCDSEAEAQSLWADLKVRMTQCQLELHPEKTQVVYCVDANRRGDYGVKRFDFLGYTFKPRQSMNRKGKLFTSFSPAVSDKAAKAMRREMRNWGLSRLSRYDLGELLALIRRKIVGWVRYYGLFHSSTLQRSLKTLDFHLVRWAQRKYKKLRGHISRAWQWLSNLQQRAPTLFPHWGAAIRTTGR